LQSISKVNAENKELLIIGDFNCNYLDKKHSSDLKEQLSLNGLIQVIKQPTRTTDTCETLIDLLFTNKPEHLSDIKVIPSAISDHDVIGCKRKKNNHKSEPETITCRNFKHYDAAQIKNELYNETWDFVYETNDATKLGLH